MTNTPDPTFDDYIAGEIAPAVPPATATTATTDQSDDEPSEVVIRPPAPMNHPPVTGNSKTIQWQCMMCSGVFTATITVEQAEFLAKMGMPKLRPNVCEKCHKTKDGDLRLTAHELKEANFNSSVDTRTFRRWENMMRDRARTYLAGFNGNEATDSDEFVALRCTRMIEVARKSRTQTDDEPSQKTPQKQGSSYDKPIRKRSDFDE